MLYCTRYTVYAVYAQRKGMKQSAEEPAPTLGSRHKRRWTRHSTEPALSQHEPNIYYKHLHQSTK